MVTSGPAGRGQRCCCYPDAGTELKHPDISASLHHSGRACDEKSGPQDRGSRGGLACTRPIFDEQGPQESRSHISWSFLSSELDE